MSERAIDRSDLRGKSEQQACAERHRGPSQVVVVVVAVATVVAVCNEKTSSVFACLNRARALWQRGVLMIMVMGIIIIGWILSKSARPGALGHEAIIDSRVSFPCLKMHIYYTRMIR